MAECALCGAIATTPLDAAWSVGYVMCPECETAMPRRARRVGCQRPFVERPREQSGLSGIFTNRFARLPDPSAEAVQNQGRNLCGTACAFQSPTCIPYGAS